MLHHGAFLCESKDSRFSCIDYGKDLIAVGNAKGSIYFYKLCSKATRIRSGPCMLHVAAPANDKSLQAPLTLIKFSPCQTYIAVGTASGTVLVCNLTDSNLNIKCRHDNHCGKAISALCWSADSSKLFSGCIGGLVIELILTEALSASSMALNFVSALLNGTNGRKPTTLICECKEIVRQIECTFSESCSFGSGDILLVSVAHHSLLFQLPKNRNMSPRFSDISLHAEVEEFATTEMVEGKKESAHFDRLWCASCFYDSFVSTEGQKIGNVKHEDNEEVIAAGIIVAQYCESGIQLVYCTINGEVIRTFKLKVPFRDKVGDDGMENCHKGVRYLRTFINSDLHNNHKHLMTLITANNSILLINLRDMSYDYLLGHYDYSVHAAVSSHGKLLVLYENVEVDMIMIDLLECLFSSGSKAPLRIFDSRLYLAFTIFKQYWKLRRQREIEADKLCSTYRNDRTIHDSFSYYEPNQSFKAETFIPATSEFGSIIGHMVDKPFFSDADHCSRTVFCRRLSDIKEAESIIDAAMQNRLNDMETALNNILNYWDEELESWAFEAASSSLSSIVNGKPLCKCLVNSTTVGDRRSSHGVRSLDEIVKYGAILSASQGVNISEEALAQLASLRRVSSPESLVDGGYDYYGLDEECQKQRLAHILIIKTRNMNRRKLLKAILAETYALEDLIAPFYKCGPSQSILTMHNVDLTSRSNVEAVNVSENKLDEQIPQDDTKERNTSEVDINCLEVKVNILNCVEKALKNTALVLNLDLDQYKGISATHSITILEERKANLATTMYHNFCDQDDLQILLNTAAELIVSTTLILERNHDISFDITDDGYRSRTDCGSKVESPSGICEICCGPGSKIIDAMPSDSSHHAAASTVFSTTGPIAFNIAPSIYNTADRTSFSSKSTATSSGNIAKISNSSTNGSEVISNAIFKVARPMKLQYSSSDGIGGVNNYGSSDDFDGATPNPVHSITPIKSSPLVRSRTGSWMSPATDDGSDIVLESHLSSVCPTEDDSGYSPFTDSDKSWVEWWWDLDPTIQRIMSESHSSLNEGLRERTRDEGASEDLPGIALKKRITRARLKHKVKKKSRLQESVEFRSLDGGYSKDVQSVSITPFGPPSPSVIPVAAKKLCCNQCVVVDIKSVDSLTDIRTQSSPRNMYDITVIAPKGLGLNLSLLPGCALLVRAFNPLSDGSIGPVERAGIVKGGDYLLGVNEISLIGMGLEQIAEILLNIDRMGQVREHPSGSANFYNL
jgi:hypothetical protein